MNNDPLDRTAKWFRSFAETSRDRSPLYSRIGECLAADRELLPLAVSPIGQPPHVLLAAVHYLLLQGNQHPLADWYPSVSQQPRPLDGGDIGAAFHDFCGVHRARLVELVESGIVQTNEVTRCSYLYIVFNLVSELAGGAPLSLIELGASAGLNLIWDHYGYRYDNGVDAGRRDSPVQVASQLRGTVEPPIPATPPPVASRRGVDLNTIDLDDSDQVMWLRSMIWPEQLERAARMERAVELARRHPPDIVPGDALRRLPELLDEAPPGPVCVFHTHVIHTWTEASREQLTGLLDAAAATRTLFRVSTEWLDAQGPLLRLTSWLSGRAETQVLARCDDHGRWFEWLG